MREVGASAGESLPRVTSRPVPRLSAIRCTYASRWSTRAQPGDTLPSRSVPAGMTALRFRKRRARGDFLVREVIAFGSRFVRWFLLQSPSLEKRIPAGSYMLLSYLGGDRFRGSRATA